MTSPLSTPNLDLRNILDTALRQFAPWLVMVLIVTFAGQPGVVCVTPVAWLLALRAGLMAVNRSKSDSATVRKTEAALAGSLLGLLQGLLFALVITRLEPINAQEQTQAITLTVGMILVGMLAGASLAFVTAYLTEQRQNRSDT
jgi:MFS family permease